MAKAAGARPKKDAIDRELLSLQKLTKGVVTSAPLDPAGAEARLRAGWAARAPLFEKGLPEANEEGRALFARAKAFVDAGLPAGLRDVDEQAAFFVVAALAHIPDAPCWSDFVERWARSGGLAHAIEIILRFPVGQHRKMGADTEIALSTSASDVYLSWVLASLGPQVAALDADARAALRTKVASLTSRTTPEGTAALAVLFDDEPLAREAIARADAVGLSYRDPWPVELFAVIRDGDTFAHLLARGGAAFQFFGASYVLRARGRVPDAGLADALVRFFVAAMAEPRRMLATYAAKFAAVACAIPDPRLAWLFAEHGKHAFLKKHAPFYAARHPDVRPATPSEETLAARLVPEEPAPRPAGYTHAELDALAPDARDEHVLKLLASGHLGTALALRILADHPTPRLAAAIFAKVTSRDFATQMPKPGFHKELQADLTALGKKHPELGRAIAAAKKAKTTK